MHKFQYVCTHQMELNICSVLYASPSTKNTASSVVLTGRQRLRAARSLGARVA